MLIRLACAFIQRMFTTQGSQPDQNKTGWTFCIYLTFFNLQQNWGGKTLELSSSKFKVIFPYQNVRITQVWRWMCFTFVHKLSKKMFLFIRPWYVNNQKSEELDRCLLFECSFWALCRRINYPGGSVGERIKMQEFSHHMWETW